MRRFVLVRDTDVSKVSGEGVVVWGICFPDGTCAYRWNTTWRTSVFADSIEDVEHIHGHGGATRVVWLDTAEGGRIWEQVAAVAPLARQTITIRPTDTPAGLIETKGGP